MMGEAVRAVSSTLTLDNRLQPRAAFSPCRTWRYSLTRAWELDGSTLMVIGLNPSTADETVDDPTIRRCLDFARRWGHGRLVMTNLFAYRSTDPRGLMAAADPVGPGNDDVLLVKAVGAQAILAAWGTNGALHGRALAVLDLFRDHSLIALGHTRDGHPRHPLYVAADTQPAPVRWPDIPFSDSEPGEDA